MIHLTPEILLAAYSQGVFPMAHPDGLIYWYSPDPRAVLPLDSLHVSRSLRRTVRRGIFDIRMDTAFEDVLDACAQPNRGRQETWISAEIADAYNRLHSLGYAHSVEAWRGENLVGGLYGVSLRGLFAGESMFSRERDASKVALYYLTHHLRERKFLLLDVQFQTSHLERLGAIEIPRYRYLEFLRQAMAMDVNF
jgi:leucyl/phenylalanyl-tRNA---protein transferase